MRLRIEPTTNFDLDWYSNSKLVAINTCPRWGVIRFGQNKQWQGSGRAMALEAGGASHEAYAAIRLFELGYHGGLVDHMRYHATRLFGDNAGAILNEFERHPDWDTCAINMGIAALHLSGFYDDPSDRRRTMSNIEEGIIAYHQRYPYGEYPIWVADVNDPTAPVGIEYAFDLTVIGEDVDTPFEARYIGTLDGLHTYKDRRPAVLLQENKTGSRIDDTWADSFKTNNQVTGYMMAAMRVTNLECTEGIIRGMAIPLPRSFDIGGIRDEPIHREAYQFGEWMRWFVDGVTQYRAYIDDPFSAPMYTHSCNRYFRPCSFIPLCASPPEEAQEMLSEMEQAPMSPSEQALMGKTGE